MKIYYNINDINILLNMNIPDEFICPITLDIMNDPVICEDSYTYEREAIMALDNSISPMTRQPINKSNLIPNRALKNAIDRYKERYKESLNKNPDETVKIQEKLKELQRKRLEKLSEFEREQKLKEQEKINRLIREREKEREKELEQKRIRNIREEQQQENKRSEEGLEITRILNMFNSNPDMPCLNSKHVASLGDIGFQAWCGFHKPIKFLINSNNITTIKNTNIDALYADYKSLCQDYTWIKENIFELKEIKSDEEKFNMLRFLDKYKKYFNCTVGEMEICIRNSDNTISKYIKIHNNYDKICCIEYRQNNLISAHIEEIIHKNNGRKNDINHRDFIKLFQLAKIFIEIIEFVRPEITIRNQE
jgi:hypothetical protein